MNNSKADYINFLKDLHAVFKKHGAFYKSSQDTSKMDAFFALIKREKETVHIIDSGIGEFIDAPMLEVLISVELKKNQSGEFA
jgi:hypothetical protein